MEKVREEEAYDVDDTVVPSRPPMDYEPTGVDSVDRVLEDVASITDAPVGEHVAVFERAHEQLRRALDARPESADDEQGS
jgi:hypothetical protein